MFRASIADVNKNANIIINRVFHPTVSAIPTINAVRNTRKTNAECVDISQIGRVAIPGICSWEAETAYGTIPEIS
jgi:hypothetical protein